MKLFLSFRSLEAPQVERLYAALDRRCPGRFEIFLDRKSLLPGDVWQQRLVDEVAAADAVVLVLGQKLGPWQEREFQEAQRLNALPGRAGRPRIIPVALSPDATMPPFAALYHYVIAPEPDNDAALDAIVAALDRTDPADPTAAWRRVNPYKGLAALEAADSAFFFGREAETIQVLERMREQPKKVLMLLGNSGVGKSSLVQAGVLDALRTQRWPSVRGTGAGHDPNRWIGGLADCHRWPAVVFRPGQQPILELVSALLRLAPEPGADLEEQAAKWTGLLIDRKTTVDRLRQHVRKVLAERTGEAPPERFLIYVDQGEELYGRSEAKQRARFSELLAEAATADDGKAFQILASMRSDYYGQLQNDEPLFAASERIDLRPMSDEQLKQAIARPAECLGVRFDPAEAPADLAKRGAVEAGALPLLADLLSELWRDMEKRDDGVLRWRPGTDLGDVSRALSVRADRYLAANPNDRDALRSLMTLRLAYVPAQGEPVRRRALRSQCSADEWRIAGTLATQDWRLLTVSENAATHEPVAEVAHEQLLRSWKMLADWLLESRAFLIWKGTLEQDRLDWIAAGRPDDALLLGHALTRARLWKTERGSLLDAEERGYIEASEQRAAHEEARIAQEKREAEEARLAEQRARIAAENTANRRIRRVTMLAGAVAIVLLIGAGLLFADANSQRHVAEDLRHKAAEDRKRASITQARNIALASKSELPRGDWGTALALALEALPRDVGVDGRPYLTEAAHALQDAVRHRPRELMVLRGHQGFVRSVAFSRDGTLLVTASSDKTARIWEVSSGRELQALRGHEDGLMHAAFSLDGTRVVTASADGTARVWEVPSGREVAVLRGHDGAVNSAVFSADGSRVLTASFDMTARIWEVSSQQVLRVLSGHTNAVNTAVFSSDGTRVLTASWDGTARLWEASSGQPLTVLRGHEANVWSAVFSPDDTRAITASADLTARVWELSDGRALTELHHGEMVLGAAMSPDGSRVVTAVVDKSVRLWEASSSRELAVLRGHEGPVWAAVFSPDGSRLATVSLDATVRLWEAPKAEPGTVPIGPVRVWDVLQERELAMLHGHKAVLNSAALSPDKSRMVTASEDGTARVWDVSSGRELSVMLGHERGVLGAVFSADGSRIVTASYDRTSRVWDAASGRELAALRGHADAVGDAAFSRDGTRVVTASADMTARVWEVSSGHELVTLRGHTGPVRAAAFSADGSRVVTASHDATARIWEASSGKQLSVLPGHEQWLSSAAFSPDGTLVATASYDYTARVWEVSSGRALSVLRGHESVLGRVVFSPDGAQVLTASADQTARLWEVSSGRELALLRGHRGPVNQATFSTDGSRLLTASSDGTVRLWPNFRMPQQLIDEACRLMPRPLSRAQREAFVLDREINDWPCGWAPDVALKPAYTPKAPTR